MLCIVDNNEICNTRLYIQVKVNYERRKILTLVQLIRVLTENVTRFFYSVESTYPEILSLFVA